MTVCARRKYAGARVTLNFLVRLESAMNLVKSVLALSLGASSLLALAEKMRKDQAAEIKQLEQFK